MTAGAVEGEDGTGTELELWYQRASDVDDVAVNLLTKLKASTARTLIPEPRTWLLIYMTRLSWSNKFNNYD